MKINKNSLVILFLIVYKLSNSQNKTIIVKPTQLDDSIGVYGAFSLVITNLFKERKILQADFKDIKGNKKKI